MPGRYLSRSLDYPWLFINSEMRKFAATLADSKLRSSSYDIAKAVFDLTSSRFQSPKNSLRFIRVYLPEPAYRIWERGGKMGSLKQSIAVKAMLLATGEFREDDVKLMRSRSLHFSLASGGHYFLKVKTRKGWVCQDPWGRNWKIGYGENYGTGGAEFTTVPKVRGLWNEKHAVCGCDLYVKG